MIISLKSSIGSESFQKVVVWVEISRNRFFENNRKWSRGAPALRVIRAGTRLTVYRALPLLYQWSFSKFITRKRQLYERLSTWGTPAQRDTLQWEQACLARYHLSLEILVNVFVEKDPCLRRFAEINKTPFSGALVKSLDCLSGCGSRYGEAGRGSRG